VTVSTSTVRLPVEELTPEAFAPFGVVLRPLADGTPFTAEEAALDLSAGTPRFYLMTLEDKPPRFTRITRHLETTQTLMATGGREWFLAVAPAGDLDEAGTPRLEDVRAFRITGDVAVTLHKGTWHSGPYFHEQRIDFVNLELSDTNVVDHHTYRLDEELGVDVVLEVR
jgi:ureidoglycolate hydrolase